MRFFIINTDYNEFIKWLYRSNPGLENQPYAEQYRARIESGFGTADFYSKNLRRLGHEAWDVIANIEPMQKRWARENGVRRTRWGIKLRYQVIPWPYKYENEEWLYSILAEQIKSYRPDILYSMAMETIDSKFLSTIKGFYRLAVGQHAATKLDTDFSMYDLILSSLPSQVEYFKVQGIKSELFRLGFEETILAKLAPRKLSYDIVFIGGLGGIYAGGVSNLERLAERFDAAIWGYGINYLEASSPLHRCYRGPLFGVEMFQTLHNSKIAFNRHSNLADLEYANNMRLYEATGVGTLLLTDYKQNLSDMFDPGREVIAYRNTDECVELAGYYLTHDEEREKIARAGQRRTLTEHTYHHRMQELVDIVQRYL
jgi:spore maturation protein CgeB